MADEPTLCFDGDAAGRRAAYRALDVALPLLRPGKSLRFATLPDGNDPDDLVRSGGRARDRGRARGRPRRSSTCCGCGRPKPAASTRRNGAPALEARLGAVMTGIGDESVRRYYRQEFGERLRSLFEADEPAGRRGPGRRGRWPQGRNPRAGGSRRIVRRIDGPGGGTGGPQRPRPTGIALRAGRYLVSSPQLAASPIHRGDRVAISRREALILQTALNHPWLLHDHLEDIAEVEFRFAEAEKVKVALIDILRP